MPELLWSMPALPLAGFAALALFGGGMSRRGVAVVGVGSVGLAALAALGLAIGFLAAPPPGGAWTAASGDWFRVGSFEPALALRLDPLAIVMTLVVCGVGFLIHLYSAEFMEEDEGYSRFFAYLNLFVGSMLVLVLADDLLLLYLGWEGVGLCSYLLIGFWYADPLNGRAARKAFVVTRIGDAAMAVGLLLLFTRLGTLEIPVLMARAVERWPPASAPALAAAALLLVGAIGKSAQLPLQVWLPDAMAGPTPVSALIHAATMVTAGVYLIARTHALFELAPAVLESIAVIGTATLLVAGLAALAQRDIKRILAYSTISQIGYMFLGLGVGAWSAAVFHLMTHAFFKALLFLGAGAVIVSLDHEHDIFRMGGLRRQIPLTFWTFLIAAAALAGFPLVTAGFYSKESILSGVWSSPLGGPWLWTAGLAGALLSSLYIFRLVFYAFFGEAARPIERRPGWRLEVPLVVLAALSVVGGFVELPPGLGDAPVFSRFLEPVLPPAPALASAPSTQFLLQGITALVSVGGIALAWGWFRLRPRGAQAGGSLARALRDVAYAGFGFDRLYDGALVHPFVRLASFDRDDWLDRAWQAVAAGADLGFRTLRRTQTGVVRRYAAGLALGAVVVVALMVLL